MDRERDTLDMEQIQEANADDYIKEVNISGITRQAVVNLLNDYGVIKKGHFVLLSGLHAPNFIQFNLLAQTLKLSQVLAKKFISSGIDLVFTPETSGITLAGGIADALRADLLLAPIGEDSYPTDIMTNNEILRSHRKVLICVDIITSATGLNKLKDIVEQNSSIVVGIAAFINRGYISTEKIKQLSKVDNLHVVCTGNFKHYESKSDCPLCKENIAPITMSKNLNFALSSSQISELKRRIAA